MKQPSYYCSCIICHKQTSSLGIDTHFMRIHGTNEQQQLFKNSAIACKLKKQKAEYLYDTDPKLCKECSNKLDYANRHNKFCSRKCSATFSNRRRVSNGWTMSDHAKTAISKKLTKLPKVTIHGEFTKIRFQNCKFCKTLFVTTCKGLTCKECQHLKWKNGKDQYSFTFNVYNYPDLFDLSLLSQLGWVAFGGKRGGAKNVHGVSRDHRVSIADAKMFNYAPYYISHPINCEIMPHAKNNKKKSQSSLLYSELVRLVDEYDNRGDCWEVSPRP